MAAEVSRLGSVFSAASGTTGLIPFITAGYPSIDGSLELLQALDRPGVLALEIGIPFSDPIADGPEIQRASEWALRSGVGAKEVLGLVTRFRRDSHQPVVLMTYANPVLRRGIESFARAARDAGVDGIILSDLPPDESPDVWEGLDRAGLDTIVLVAPTTDAARLPRLLDRARGFVGRQVGDDDAVHPSFARRASERLDPVPEHRVDIGHEDHRLPRAAAEPRHQPEGLHRPHALS